MSDIITYIINALSGLVPRAIIGTIPFVVSFNIALTPKKRTFIYNLYFSALVFLVILLKLYIDSYYGVTMITVIANLVANYLIMCFFTKESFKVVGKFYLILIAIMAVNELAVTFIYYALGNQFDSTLPSKSVQLITAVTYTLLLIITIYVWKHIRQITATTGLWSFIATFILQSIVIVSFILSLPSLNSIPNIKTIIIYILISWVVTDIFFVKTIIDNHSKAQLRISLNQAMEMEKMQYKYYENLTQTLNTLRKYRHDFGNILQTLSVTINNPETFESGKELFDQIYQRFDDTQIPYYCGNPVINALLLSKFSAAHEKNVTLDVSVNLENVSDIENLDLCSVFSNLLDNALEAASEVENGEIKLTAGSDTGYLFVKCENSYNGKVLRNGKKFTSTKGKNRGLGLSIVESIAKKYDGSLITECNETFSSLVVLKPEK